LKLRVNVVLMRQNVAGFAKLCSELSAWGIAEITFNQLGGRDRPGFHPPHRLRLADVDVLEAQLRQIRIRLDGCGTALIGGENYISRIRSSARGERNPVEDCGPGESFCLSTRLAAFRPAISLRTNMASI